MQKDYPPIAVLHHGIARCSDKEPHRGNEKTSLGIEPEQPTCSVMIGMNPAIDPSHQRYSPMARPYLEREPFTTATHAHQDSSEICATHECRAWKATRAEVQTPILVAAPHFWKGV